MEPMNIAEIAEALNGKLMNCKESFMVNGINTDSRKVKSGELFIPIKGPNFDGHDFIYKAMDAGACAAISHNYLNAANFPYILVEDTQAALMRLASYYRSKFNIPAVAVTGSSGKTTTKEMIASVLGESFQVLKNEGNLNNTIGLPMTVFRMEKHHTICVFEMGMNKPGEIESLASIVKPDVGIITNVGTAHIEFLGSRENILKAKKEIFTYFTVNNTAIINGDDDMLASIHDLPCKIIKYGINNENDLSAKDVKQRGDEGMEFTLNINGNAEPFFVPLIGVHNVYNALCSIAVGLTMKMEIEKIKKGLARFIPGKMRMEIFSSKNGIRVINDSYNANPDSVSAAIEVLRNMSCRGRRVLILADMMELGEYSEIGHRKVGEKAVQSKVDILITIGEKVKDIRQGALDNDMKEENIYCFSSNNDAISNLRKILMPYDTVLIKGSRIMKLEEIADSLRERGFTKDE